MALVHLTIAIGAGLLGLASSETASASKQATLGVETRLVGTQHEQVVPAPLDRVDDAVRQHMAEREVVGMGVGIVKDGQVIYLKGYGYEDLASQTPLLAQRTKIRWASISKPVTAIIAARLARSGIVDLDAPIQTYFTGYRAPKKHVLKCKKGKEDIKHHGERYPCSDGYADIKVPKAERTVTLRSLLAHTSGIRAYGGSRKSANPARRHLNNPKRNKGLAWGLKKVLRSPFAYMPGHDYVYSTFGYNLAAHVMEHATGKDFPALIQEHIIEPSGLESLQPDYAWDDIPNRSTGYRMNKRKRTIVTSKTYDVSWKMAGGGLISTPQDLTRFCQAIMGDTLLTDADKETLWTEQKTRDGQGTDYGLGFGVDTRMERRFVEHAGVQPQTRSHLRLYPDEGLCILVMANTTTAKTTSLVQAIDDALKLD